MPDGRSGLTASGPRILVIDDQTDVRKRIADGLTELHFDVLEAATLAEASETVAQGPPFGAVVVDVALKDGFGESFAKLMRAASPGTPVIIVTGYGESAMRERLSSDPGLAVLGKPLCLEVLARALATLGVEPHP
ncbi:MAG: response regulator [Brevundimonas sp.]|uniref:response regulator n=1 Tax=Brevundimonas sp. TaxID=1871086 RepID=UPI0026397112|nr:response regulator [Brevundimonas sp.]MDI6623198.1 response regulator [Brevundimonas sp.]MDQ7811349.1 response regulator [Brevundimonas sp.]